LLYHLKCKDMAKQKGPKFITGTIGGLTYYKLEGTYYVRKKSTLSRKRVKRSPAFQRTMEYAGLLGQASKLASVAYRMLPREKQKVERYRGMTGKAMQLLKEGLDTEEVQARLSGGKARSGGVKAGACFVAPPAKASLLPAMTAAVNNGESVPIARPAPKPVTVRKHVPVFCTGRPVIRRRRGRVVTGLVIPSRSVHKRHKVM
jgi:hypothetical protein